MSNGLPVDKAPDGKGMNISHAKGLKPGVDVDWYDAARRALGVTIWCASFRWNGMTCRLKKESEPCLSVSIKIQ